MPTPERPVNAVPVQRVLCTACGTLQTNRTLLPLRLHANAHDFDHATDFGRLEAALLADRLASRFQLRHSDLVIDIGSNDGTLLREFQENGLRVLGVEPSALRTAHAYRDGVLTIHGQFGPVLARYLFRRIGRARLIVSRFLLGVWSDVPAFLQAIATLLEPGGVAVLQVRHALGVYRELGGEMIHGLNPCAFTVLGLAGLVGTYGLALKDVEQGPPQSASLFVTFQPAGGADEDRSVVQELVDRERSAGLQEVAGWNRFTERWGEVCTTVRERVQRLVCEGMRVSGYAASPEAITLLEAARLGEGLLSEVLDPNPHAHGKWTSVGSLPILGTDRVSVPPDMLVVLDRCHVADAVRWAQHRPRTQLYVPFATPFDTPTLRPIPRAA